MLYSKTKLAGAKAGARVDRTEGLTSLDGRAMYCIPGYSALRPFLMTIISDCDLWMFLSSTGGLTAGRANEDGAIFPYETDDKLHQSCRITGPQTSFRIRVGQQATVLWEPFAGALLGGDVRRNLYKSLIGNEVVFEEINDALGLTFRYGWRPTDQFGFVRTCTLVNHAATESAEVDVLDGVLNVLPADCKLSTQRSGSCLINAYTRCEVDPGTGLAIFALTSQITDRAEPTEALHANTVWCHGLPGKRVLLSGDQIDAFRDGWAVEGNSLLTGRRGNYLVCSNFSLEPGQRLTWNIVADARRDQFQVAALQAVLADPETIAEKLASAAESCSANLTRIVAAGDGLAATANPLGDAHHFANVTFNNMRGGIPIDQYGLPSRDFVQFVHERNRRVHARRISVLEHLPETVSIHDLIRAAQNSGDADLHRLALEYLPLSFSRRHGDPSRPWNRFNIRARGAGAAPLLDYEGNWRDIFQNWEAMCLSFPEFTESVIAKFLNASTVDGFNAYRISRAGIDWDAPDPDEPWSNIGYWGDHQIVYLLKFLEASRRFHPGALEGWLARPMFSYADVPYRIKSFHDIAADHHNTIDFDHSIARKVERRAAETGGDGKLLHDYAGEIVHATLLEKLLVSALAKLSNFVPGGGIWLNTQRPEWNDANNALAGNGLSIVTACYLRRFATFCAELLDSAGDVSADISNEVAEWFEDLSSVLVAHEPSLDSHAVSDTDRRHFLDAAGEAFSRYRATVYRDGFSARRKITCKSVASFFRLAARHLEHTIRGNRRADGLYHSYNLLNIKQSAALATIDHLPEMLEGQVAVLSSGVLSAAESAELLGALFKSALYRSDQQSFLLYPERELPAFMEKNVIPESQVNANPLLIALIASDNRAIVARDADGLLRFSSDFVNSAAVSHALDRLAEDARWATLVAAHRQGVLECYERVFHHRSFTGRSGAIYGYEGIGCIYWHMAAKLLLATQEVFLRAAAAPAPPLTLRTLADSYYHVRRGLGFNKTSREYGACPIDPYSHTPKHAGAQQPGMTGQVKEEILTRFGELGVTVEDASLVFRPRLLRRSEFLAAAREWSYVNSAGEFRQLALPAKSLAFTLCQLPVIYKLGGSSAQIHVVSAGGKCVITGDRLDAETSRAVFSRSGQIQLIEVNIPERSLEVLSG
jgi:hypothetical protein